MKTFLTFDVDWAPEEVISYTVDILNEYGAKATFFATHDSPVLHGLDSSRFEIGIHPDFNKLLSGKAEEGETYETVIRNLLAIYPAAKGARSHSLTQNGQIINSFVKEGLKYDSNIFLPYQAVKPYMHCNGLYRIPFNWEDDVHFFYKKRFDDTGLDHAAGDLLIYDFHPVHVYLNTDTEETYNRAKADYHNAQQLARHRNTMNKGSQDALRKILSAVKSEDTCRLIDLLEN